MSGMTSAAEVRKWVAEHVGDALIDVSDTGRHVVYADPVICPRLDWFAERGIDLEQPDGSLQLDSAGEHRYVPIRALPDGRRAYERV